MRNIFLTITTAMMATLCLTSCEKDEGKGGDSSIAGYVYQISDDGNIEKGTDGSYHFVRDTTPAVDKNIFIVYGGGNGAYDDKTATNGNGYFKFSYLRKGDYSVYAVGDSGNADEATYRSINIGSTGTHNVASIYIYNGKNSNLCGVVGNLQALYASQNKIYINGASLRVYIRNIDGGDQNDTRADDNGNYAFTKLTPNRQYIVWAESEPKKNAGIYAVRDTFTTNAAGSISMADTLKVTVY